MSDLKAKIREIPDFPKQGILFYDITTLLKEAGPYREALERLAAPYREQDVELVASVESRGFLLGAPLAYLLGAGLVPIRKPGKLPAAQYEVEHTLEYGASALTIHQDAIRAGQRVLIVDDLLATGGTAAAAVQLVTRLGGKIVGIVFLVELAGLQGRERLRGHDVLALLTY